MTSDPRWLDCYQVDAFTSRPFGGNSAAIVPLESWLPDATMQAMAAENAVAETAFFVGRPDGDFDLRWFTPEVEVDLCGHATLASAFLLFERLEPNRTRVRFHTRSGALDVERAGAALAMDLPARPPSPLAESELAPLAAALGRRPAAALRARDVLAVFETADEVRALQPDMRALAALDAFAVCATAPGGGQHDRDVDFVSRFFAPKQGIPEDPVTGSAHSTLVPYWSQRLGKKELRARQVSRRVGELTCESRGDRVRLVGHAVMTKTGSIVTG